MTDKLALTIVDNAAASRFETTIEGRIATAAYVIRDGVMVMHHTEVPREFEGRGIAAQLVAAALTQARARGLKVDPRCSYVAAYMRRHPDTQDLHV